MIMKGMLAAFAVIFSLYSVASAYEFNPGISLSLSEEYNDNILLRHDDRESDFVTYISPSVYFSLRSGGGSELSANYTPSFSSYASNSDQNSTSHNASARGSFAISEDTRVSISDTFVMSEELRYLTRLADLGPIRTRTELRVNTLRGDVSQKLGEHFSLLLGASYIDNSFKDPGFNDFRAYSGSAGLAYRINPRTTVSANAGYSKYDYRLASDAHSEDYTVAFTRRLTPTLTLEVTGGAVLTEIENGGRSSTDFSGGIDLMQRLDRGSAIISLRQSIEPGLEEGGPLRTRAISLRLIRPLSEWWTVTLTPAYFRYKSVSAADRDSDMFALDAALTYDIRRWAGLSLSYGYANFNDRRSRTGDYNNNRVALTLRVHLDKRRMAMPADQEQLPRP